MTDPQRAPRGRAEGGLEADTDLEEGDLSRRLDAASFCFYGRVAESLLMTSRVLCAEHPSLPAVGVATLCRDLFLWLLSTPLTPLIVPDSGLFKLPVLKLVLKFIIIILNKILFIYVYIYSVFIYIYVAGINKIPHIRDIFQKGDN